MALQKVGQDWATFMALLGLHCCVQAFSGFGKQGLPSSCSAGASHRGGLFCCRVDPRVHGLSSCGHTGLAALQHVQSSWTKDNTHVPCIGRQILNQCTTRKGQENKSQKFSTHTHTRKTITVKLWIC